MPIRSLRSSVLRWPDTQQVDQAVRRWAAQCGPRYREVLRIGYFGSYAKGNWGVGSDLDLVIVVEDAERPFERRVADLETTGLPVPTDVLVYTEPEWKALSPHRRMAQMLRHETVWVYVKAGRCEGD